jgi:hypothetical protein
MVRRLTVADLEDLVADLRRDLAHEKRRYDTDVEDLRQQLNDALDAKGDVQASLDSITMTHLEEQQRWGIERERLIRQHKEQIEEYREKVWYWIGECRGWGERFLRYQQKSEYHTAKLQKRVGSWRFLWFIMLITATLWAVAWAIK